MIRNFEKISLVKRKSGLKLLKWTRSPFSKTKVLLRKQLIMYNTQKNPLNYRNMTLKINKIAIMSAKSKENSARQWKSEAFY